MAIQKSVEYIEVSITASTEGTWVNLTKSQNHAQCVPFFSVRGEQGQGTDQHQDRLGEVQFRDNAGTPQVRVVATSREGTAKTLFAIFVVEFEAAINVQQLAVSDFTGTSTTKAITTVTALADAFAIYSYQFTSPPAGDDDWNDAQVQVSFNSITEIQLERRASGGTVNGTLYIVDCDSSEWTVQHIDIDVTVSSTTSQNSAGFTAVVLVDTFIVHSYETSESADDMRDGAWISDLNATTTVRLQRGDASPTGQDATSTHTIFVVECNNNEWDVQRNAVVTMTAESVTDSITAIDQARSIATITDNFGKPFSVGRNDSTAGGTIDNVQTAIDFQTDALIRLQQRQNALGTDIIGYEVIQFASAVSGAIAAALPIAFGVTADLKAQGKLDAALATVYAVTADLGGDGKLDAALATVYAITADLKATGKLDAALPIVFNTVADLKALGKLDAALATVFAVTADLKATGKLDAALGMAFAVTADLKADGKLDAALSIVFAVVADLKADGKLDATLATAFGVAADLKATGKLDAALAIVFAVAANLIDANLQGPIDAVLPISFGVAADLKADGKLDASLATVFAVVADLKATGKLNATLATVFAVAAELKATGQLDAALALVFGVAADLKADGKLDAALNLVFGVAADLKAGGKLDAALPIALNIAADLKAKGKLDAALPLVFGVAANLTDATLVGPISAVLPISFGMAADLNATGKLDALLPLVFGLTASLTDATPAAAPVRLADPTIYRPPRRRFRADTWNQFAETFDAFLRRQETLVREVIQEAAPATVEDTYNLLTSGIQYSNAIQELYQETRTAAELIEEPSTEIVDFLNAQDDAAVLMLVELFDQPMVEIIEEAQDEQDILAIVALIASASFTLH